MYTVHRRLACAPSERTLLEWRNRVAAEYRLAALTAQVVHWMIVAALPRERIGEGQRLVADELDHARLSHACLVALGGPDEPAVLDPAALAAPDDEGVLAALVDSIVRNFCLGETLAVPLFAAMWAEAEEPAVRSVIERVLRDETRHRQFGWDVLDELLARDEEGVRARVVATLPAFLAELGGLYAPDGDGPPVEPEERRYGLLDLDDYRRVFWETVRGDLARRFRERDVAMPAGFR